MNRDTGRPGGIAPPGRFAFVAVALWLLSACASLPTDVGGYGATTDAVELRQTPFFPQERYQCGPAALATVLVASGVETGPEALVSQVYLPGRQGSLKSELLAATRRAGRLPYALPGSLSAVTDELRAGRPVLVLQNLGVSWFPRWHYAVVVGVDPVRDRVVLRSGTEQRREVRTNVFLRTWQRGDFWALVSLKPGELPMSPDRERYIEAAAALEQTGHHQSARAAWQAALPMWPDDARVQFGLANAHYALGDLNAAESAYRQLLVRDETHVVARNNLAMTLLAKGDRAAALAQIDQALATTASDSPLRAPLEETRREVLAAAHAGY